MAVLLGVVHPIRLAEGRYLADELPIHYVLIPRTNRGIVAINELPDLPERIQVSLFNILEERDVQIRGYSIRLPLDILLVVTANPDEQDVEDRKSTRLNSSHVAISYAVFCLKKKKKNSSLTKISKTI